MSASQNRPTVLIFLFGLLFTCFCSALTQISAGAETKPSLVASSGPPLYLSRGELAKLRQLAGPNGSLHLRLLIVVDHGKFAKIEATESSGDFVLHHAVVGWLRKNWKFAPSQSGSFNLPVVVAIAKG